MLSHPRLTSDQETLASRHWDVPISMRVDRALTCHLLDWTPWIGVAMDNQTLEVCLAQSMSLVRSFAVLLRTEPTRRPKRLAADHPVT
jgi:hypothetical protein